MEKKLLNNLSLIREMNFSSGCGKRNNIALTDEGIPNNSLIVVSGLGIENYIVENNKKKIKKL